MGYNALFLTALQCAILYQPLRTRCLCYHKYRFVQPLQVCSTEVALYMYVVCLALCYSTCSIHACVADFLGLLHSALTCSLCLLLCWPVSGTPLLPKDLVCCACKIHTASVQLHVCISVDWTVYWALAFLNRRSRVGWLENGIRVLTRGIWASARVVGTYKGCYGILTSKWHSGLYALDLYSSPLFSSAIITCCCWKKWCRPLTSTLINMAKRKLLLL